MAHHLVLLAGGRGTRFWPMSRRARPKQLLPLLSGSSLLRDTWQRIAPLAEPARTWVVTGADLAGACRRELPEIPGTQVLAEPVGRNTAAAVAWAALSAGAQDPRAVLAVFPSDHSIADVPAFRRLARRALACARREDALVTLGVVPTSAHTGYGYIECAQEPRGEEPIRARGFVEKPDPERAARFLAGGRHLWNSGMFFFSLRALEQAFLAAAPEIWEALAPLAGQRGRRGFAARLAAAYAKLPALPFDVAVVEKTASLLVLPAEMGWSDVGDWEALGALLARREGNSVSGTLCALDAAGNIVMDPQGLTALLGVENLLVVRAGDAVLVCRRDRAQDLRRLVSRLEDEGLARYL